MEKKVYIRPEIIRELELETRAGSPIPPGMPGGPGGSSPDNNFPWPPGG